MFTVNIKHVLRRVGATQPNINTYQLPTTLTYTILKYNGWIYFYIYSSNQIYLFYFSSAA